MFSGHCTMKSDIYVGFCVINANNLAVMAVPAAPIATVGNLVNFCCNLQSLVAIIKVSQKTAIENARHMIAPVFVDFMISICLRIFVHIIPCHYAPPKNSHHSLLLMVIHVDMIAIYILGKSE